MYYMSSQNKAMKDVLIWNLPAKLTCYKPSPLCAKHCYAMATENRWPNATKCRFDNLKSTKDINFVDNLICVIRSEVIKNKKFNGHVRIHESGDFYNQEYLDNWIAVANYFKEIKFLAFTKSFKLDFGNKPSNLELVMSVWEDTHTNEMPKGFPIRFTGMKGDNAFQCQVTKGKHKCNECGFKCWNLSKMKTNVWSEIH